MKSYYSKQEFINWFRNLVINTKPTTSGKVDLEKALDKYWGWSVDLKKWVASKGITKQDTSIWQARRQYSIIATSGKEWIN